MSVLRVTAFAVLICLLALVACQAAPNQKVDPRLAHTYQTLAREVKPSNLADTVKTLSSQSSRIAGYPGCDAAGRYVYEQFKKIGLEDIKVEPFHTTVPIDGGASLEVDGRRYRLYPMWPNLVRTSQLPKEGVGGPLIYCGAGRLAEFDGYDVAGSVVLLEFNSGAEWLNAPRLGAKAVIFIEPDTTMRGEAEAKFISIPVSIPRFWISKADAASLQALCAVRACPKVRLKCRMQWERRLANNITGVIKGTDPKLRDQIIVIESFYDSISVIPSLSPGAESACGIAGLLELARIYKKNPPARTVWFLATSGHFQSLQGMREYLERHLAELQHPSVGDKMKAWFARVLPGVKDYYVRKPPQIYLFAGLDLSSQTKGLGIFYKGDFYNCREDIQSKFSDIARVCRENSERIGAVLGFDPGKAFADGVNPIAGKSWRNFIPGKLALDAEAVTLAGARGVSFISTDDSRSLVDTPFDTADKVNIANLSEQTKLLACLFHHILNDTNSPEVLNVPKFPITDASNFSRMTLQGGFARLQGQVLILNLKKGYIPNEPVVKSLVVWRGWKVGAAHVANKTLMGVRGNMIQMVDENAKFRFPGIAPLTAHPGVGRSTVMAAYRLDEDTGEIVYAPDMGIFGADYYPTDVPVGSGIKDIPLVVFKCRATSVFDLIDPQALRMLQQIDIFDGDTNAPPRMFGYSLAVPEWQISHVEDVAVIFTMPRTRLKITMAAGPAAVRFLLIHATPQKPEGDGYVVGDGSSITNTALMVAKDMWTLDEFRIARLRKYRIINEGIDRLHKLAKDEMRLAEDALAEKQYSTFDAHARAAWGYESRAYPDVQKTAKDVVNGVLFYLALLLPFAYFCERLFFGYSDLKRQLVAAFAIFLLVFLAFKFFHPAFDITMNPVIVFIAFTMLALSVLVMVLVGNRFEEQLKSLNQAMSGVHKVDIGRMSIAAAAFSLGISNMRRRKARTMLTCITLIILTFTVLSFTSIVETMRFNKVAAPGKPRYNGILLRTAVWDPLQEPAYRLLRDEFGETRAVAPRAWFFGAWLGEQTFLTLKRNDKTYDAKGAVGLTAEEKEVTGVDRALRRGGRWFREEDTYTTIIPGAVADALEITDQDVGKAKVTFSGVEYTVIGIIDNKKFKRITDLDREPLTPVDFVLMQKLTQQGKTMGEAGFREYTHLEPDATFYVPYQTLVNLGGEIRSVAIDFVTPEEVNMVLKKLMPRLGLNLYAGMGDRAYRYSSIAAKAGKGFSTIFIPILIAALIVLNTMLGSVYERVKEIGIFSSLGLAPNHIAMLFMAEAMVYAILGAVAGYLIGQAASKVMYTFNLLPGLYLNFSSLSAVLSTLIVVGVVLLSTIYPARKASEVATPAIERSWKVSDPVGDVWKVEMPFAVTGVQAKGVSGFITEWFQAYEEYSVGDFVTEDVVTSEFASDYGGAHRVRCRAWLAPFDLGVSQEVILETIPTSMEDVYEVKLTINRESGDISNWKRVNRRFLNTLRRQFLIWRTMRAEERDRYLRGHEAAAPGVGTPVTKPGTAG
ncbi:MAG TPA: FtsX-like permease family protein [Armatimonadota bacterium]|nr:FtsX-like permease family protein [Armatimonadota bacterium]